MPRRFLPLLFPALLLFSAAHRTEAKPLQIFSEEDEEDSTDLKAARRELEALQDKINRKEIPPIEFELNKAVLRPHSRRALEMVADLLFKYSHLKLMVFGHTCDIGKDEYNLWLSQKRAQAVKDYLVRLGVMGESIKAKGFGESKPAVENDSEENREKNRRVEFVLTQRWWESVF